MAKRTSLLVLIITGLWGSIGKAEQNYFEPSALEVAIFIKDRMRVPDARLNILSDDVIAVSGKNAVWTTVLGKPCVFRRYQTKPRGVIQFSFDKLHPDYKISSDRMDNNIMLRGSHIVCAREIVNSQHLKNDDLNFRESECQGQYYMSTSKYDTDTHQRLLRAVTYLASNFCHPVRASPF